MKAARLFEVESGIVEFSVKPCFPDSVDSFWWTRMVLQINADQSIRRTWSFASRNLVFANVPSDRITVRSLDAGKNMDTIRSMWHNLKVGCSVQKRKAWRKCATTSQFLPAAAAPASESGTRLLAFRILLEQAPDSYDEIRASSERARSASPWECIGNLFSSRQKDAIVWSCCFTLSSSLGKIIRIPENMR